MNTVEKKAAVRSGVGRLLLTTLIILLEILLLTRQIGQLTSAVEWLTRSLTVIALILALAIYSSDSEASTKLPWIILIMTLPVVGIGLYLMVGLSLSTKRMRRRYEDIDTIVLPKLKEGQAGEDTDAAAARLRGLSRHLHNISHYIENTAGYPVYQNTDIKYFSSASECLKAQKEAISRAESFIFMEYYAIEDKETWHEIEELLAERAAAGVEVRVFYDDIGSIFFVNNREFRHRLTSKGIKCRFFNPFLPGLNIFLNNRDHRKICVIDGVTGFTGGYNLANEYFNITQPYGEWKDAGIRITGQAVRSMTATFLENWNAVKSRYQKDQVDHEADFDRFMPQTEHQAAEDAFVQPYADSPLGHEHVGEEVYITVIDKATEYCWFATPYLIITDEMAHELSIAAKRGVDVRIVTPGIPDKKLVYNATRSYYSMLVRNGVRIFEWSPGFSHCKLCVADDLVATCGTVNLDYRSFYHQFENGCVYMNCSAVEDTKKDLEHMMSQAREVTQDYGTRLGRGKWLMQVFFRLFAPLM